MKFYQCSHCKNIVAYLQDNGPKVSCCGEELKEHYIQWIALHTEQGNQRKELKPGQEPKVTFAVAPGDKPLAAYEYCNLHGLWKADI